MSVGRVGGGGGRGGPKGPKGVGGGGPVDKSGKGSFEGKVDQAESLVAPSGLVQGGNVGATDPVTAQALDIARQLKSGEIKSREEASKKLVASILKEKLRLQSRALTDRIADALQDDPRLNQALDRLWSRDQREPGKG